MTITVALLQTATGFGYSGDDSTNVANYDIPAITTPPGVPVTSAAARNTILDAQELPKPLSLVSYWMTTLDH